MAKRYRDAISGEFMTKEEATEQGKETTVAENVKPRKVNQRRRPVVKKPIVVEEPEFIEGKPNPKFKMRMDVIFRGRIYDKSKPHELPQESQDYLGNKGWKE